MDIPSSSKSPKLKRVDFQHTIPKSFCQIGENSIPSSLKDHRRNKLKISSILIQEEQGKDSSPILSPTYSDIRVDQINAISEKIKSLS